jgi:hypothetical protein
MHCGKTEAESSEGKRKTDGGELNGGDQKEKKGHKWAGNGRREVPKNVDHFPTFVSPSYFPPPRFWPMASKKLTGKSRQIEEGMKNI